MKLQMAMSTSQYSRLGEIFWRGLDISRSLDTTNFRRRLPVVAPDREYSESDVRGNHRKPPHLPVVGAGNSFDPGPARLRQEAKWGALWRL